MANETAKHISLPPSNETLSHSNGKDVFDHGPYLFIISSKNSKV